VGAGTGCEGPAAGADDAIKHSERPQKHTRDDDFISAVFVEK